MNKKIFNPADWQPKDSEKQPIANSSTKSLPVAEIGTTEIDVITQRIEATSLDIAPNYADWRDLGFALADALGESGRPYYHRLSRFYSGYTATETDKQFDNCLKAHGHGITIKTLFHLAKSAGVDIALRSTLCGYPDSSNSANSSKSSFPHYGEYGDLEVTDSSLDDLVGVSLPTFPAEVYADLPFLLRLVVEKSISPEDKDLLLLGSLVALSACLPNIYGIYAEREVYPNLFLFVTAQASAGKGRLTLCRKLVEPIHKALRGQARDEFEEYQRTLAEYTVTKDKSALDRPQEPPMRMLVIPANNSATGVFQILNDNRGIGLIFETEGDTLAQTFKSEHGNYSDGFRKAFHHETISYNRRKDREFVELQTPRLSALLSGTPKQVSTLIPSAENGLFSRFIFYFMNIRPEWNDVFAGNADQTLDNYFDHLGSQFFDLYKYLQRFSRPLRFCLTPAQQQTFNAYFSQTQSQYLYLCGMDYLATIRRLGLITFRIAMILSVLRIQEKDPIKTLLVCSDADFNAAMAMVKILVQHAAMVFQQLPSETVTTAPKNQKQQLLDDLPKEFSRKEYLVVAHKLGIPDKTAEKHIKRFEVNGLINHFGYDKYKKL